MKGYSAKRHGHCWTQLVLMLLILGTGICVPGIAGAQSIYESNGELGNWTLSFGTLSINTDTLTMTSG
ncbi:MAG TPA: hypothetical protein PK379_13005, partial [Candidatus Hydrogenedentes bacterium]|nr:hypothetical protein [Candidatus Hydrogenedentota bacterium]